MVGTDISQTAIDICNDNLQKCNDYLLSKKVSFQTANFFEMSAEDNEKFDFIFDYTFFVAIDREMRTDWAKVISMSMYILNVFYEFTRWTKYRCVCVCIDMHVW